jgi:hypothetical protein
LLWTVECGLKDSPDAITVSFYEGGRVVVAGEGTIGPYLCSEVDFLSSVDDIVAIEIQNGITGIRWRAFADLPNLTSVTIPSSVTYIREHAFAYTNLTSITILGRNISISDSAFANTNLQSITIPDDTSAITTSFYEGGKVVIAGNGAIHRHNISFLLRFVDDIIAVEIQNGITGIEQGAFSVSRNLTSVTIPSSVTFIGASAFANTNLTSITIPSSVTFIGNYAFAHTNLTSIMIPSSVTTIKAGAFEFCEKLEAINVAADNANYVSIDGVLFSRSRSHPFIALIGYPSGRQDSTYTISANVRVIESNAFSGSKLKSITIPQSVTAIKRRAFNLCDSLASITVLNTVPPKIEYEIFTRTPVYGYDVRDVYSDILPLAAPPLKMSFFVPPQSINAYRSAEFWKRLNIYSIEDEKNRQDIPTMIELPNHLEEWLPNNTDP